ncbi:hypothetical protein [Neobacillus sp. LXY-1]|uniref:hypothetical protein n=1 Tax=Neobacillus sp. LXY-1 TaxID=3379133 RepID=UPI003EE338DD
MKKLISVLMGALVAFSLFAVSGTPVKAADDCGCVVKPIIGSEKNQIVSGIISGHEFKDLKHSLFEKGYKWKGVSKTEVLYNVSKQVTMVAFPFYKQDGTKVMEVFFDGHYMGESPAE